MTLINGNSEVKYKKKYRYQRFLKLLPLARAATRLSKDATTAQMAEWTELVTLELSTHASTVSQVKPMTLKLVFAAFLLDAQH